MFGQTAPPAPSAPVSSCPVPAPRGPAQAPWHFLNFFPEPHQHGSFRPICSLCATRRWLTAGACGSAPTGPWAGAAPSAVPAPAAAATAPAPTAAPPEYVTLPPPVGELERALGRRWGSGGGAPGASSTVTCTW